MFGQMARNAEISSSHSLTAPTDQISISLPADLIERVRNAAYSLPGLTFAGLIEEAITEAIDWLERENGGAFQSR
jgi:hypothetical protein